MSHCDIPYALNKGWKPRLFDENGTGRYVLKEQMRNLIKSSTTAATIYSYLVCNRGLRFRNLRYSDSEICGILFPSFAVFCLNLLPVYP